MGWARPGRAGVGWDGKGCDVTKLGWVGMDRQGWAGLTRLD